MKILSSTVQFDVRHQTAERHELRENLRVWNTAPPPAPVAAPTKADDPPSALTAGPGDVELLLLQLLIERLTGRKMKLADVAGLLENPTAVPDLQDPAQARGAQVPDWGAVYQREELHAASEQVRFAADGVVRTADGKEIHIALSLTMSREFMSRTGIEVRAGAALRDPLIINFNGSAAQLTDRRFSFDLDADGRKEEVPMLGPDSAFVFLDRNDDGIVNDGRELFGTASGDGFADLAAYDLDRNGWIDDADPVFGRLKFWLPGMGAGSAAGLRERGVAALYLEAVDSPFELKQGAELNGQVRSTSIYLEEDGTAGTLQQVDLKV